MTTITPTDFATAAETLCGDAFGPGWVRHEGDERSYGEILAETLGEEEAAEILAAETGAEPDEALAWLMGDADDDEGGW